MCKWCKFFKFFLYRKFFIEESYTFLYLFYSFDFFLCCNNRVDVDATIFLGEPPTLIATTVYDK